MMWLLAVLAVVAAAFGIAEDGRACSRAASIVPIEPRAVVAAADAAFVGTLVDVRRLQPLPPGPGPFLVSSADPHVFTYLVEERIKGALPDRVEVLSVASTASCGLPSSVGERASLVLSRGADGTWQAGLFDLWDAEFLRRGALPLPPPAGKGRARLIAGGNFGEARTATLDGNGSVLAYGLGRGFVSSLSVCPGGKRAVELVGWKGRVSVATRRLPSLRLVAERELVPDGYGRKVSCRTATASDVLVVATATRAESAESLLYRVSAAGAKVLERASQLSVAVRGDMAYVSGASGASGELVIRNLATGSRRSHAPTAGSLDGMSVSPDGRFLAGFTGAELTVVDLVSGRTQTRRRTGHFRETSWFGHRRLAVRSEGGLEIFDPSLRSLRTPVSWTANATALAGLQAFGVQSSGDLLHVAANGDITRRGRLFSAGIATLAVLPSP